MNKRKKPQPDFFENEAWDPVRAATGPDHSASRRSSVEENKNSSKEEKKKVGFYLSADVWARFNRTFYQLKLEGEIAGNKSRLVEAALHFALDDIERAEKSVVRKMLRL